MREQPAKRDRRIFVNLVALLAACLLCITTAYADRPADTLDKVRLQQLAERGQFGQLRTILRHHPASATDAQTASLLEALDKYLAHQRDADDRRLEAYEQARTEMREKLAAGKLEDALRSAVAMHDLADDPAALLAGDEIIELTATAQRHAAEAESAGDWLEAMMLYSALRLLHEDKGHYEQDYRRARRRIALLRVYASDLLAELYEQRAKAMEQEDFKPLKVGDETWEDRLAGVEPRMLYNTLERAAGSHVTKPGYLPMVYAAVDAMLALTETPGLERTFPTLAQRDHVRAFREGLLDIEDRLDQRKRQRDDINRFEARSLLDRVMTLNDDTVQLPKAVLVFEMAQGISDALDEFSSVIWPHDKDTFQRSTAGKFYGVGIHISLRDDRLIVVSPIEDTPALRAGIKAGDIIATVDGLDTAGWSLEQAVRHITGPENTEVVLGIERKGEKNLIDLPIRRAEIIIQSVKGWRHLPEGGWDYYIDRENRIGYIRLTQFIPQSVGDIDDAVNAMEQGAGLNGLILDMRFNPGGLLSSAVDIADRFIEHGTIVSTTGAAHEAPRFRARAERTYRRVPVVVLINQGSASASEIVAGALQDYQRAIILGARSFGKGSVQDLYPIDGNDAYLKLTTQYYKLPGGRIIHREPGAAEWGIEPDLVVRMTSDQIAELIEYQLEADILRDEAGADHVEQGPAEALDDEQADGHAGAAEDEGQADELPADRSPDGILRHGLDPQVAAALLVLRTQLLTHDGALARRDEP